MENVILSNKELEKASENSVTILSDDCAFECGKSIAKAQASHLLRILKEPCTEHKTNSETYKLTYGFYHRHRWSCPDCIKQIEKEIEG